MKRNAVAAGVQEAPASFISDLQFWSAASMGDEISYH
jgi:hypothetical protein